MVAAAFTARPWLAEQLGCKTDDLALRGPAFSSLDGGMSGTYLRPGLETVEIFLSRARGGVREPAYRIVMAWLPAGERVVRIGADDPVIW